MPSAFWIDFLSNGTLMENPRHFARHERQLRIAGRSFARKTKGSKGWKRQVNQLVRLHHRIADVRKDFLHKLSTQLAKSYSTVYVEDLNIQGCQRTGICPNTSWTQAGACSAPYWNIKPRW
jgi:putative transposase